MSIKEKLEKWARFEKEMEAISGIDDTEKEKNEGVN